eukprot:13093911-Alexandrium_andersonii.AAC.1
MRPVKRVANGADSGAPLSATLKRAAREDLHSLRVARGRHEGGVASGAIDGLNAPALRCALFGIHQCVRCSTSGKIDWHLRRRGGRNRGKREHSWIEKFSGGIGICSAGIE